LCKQQYRDVPKDHLDVAKYDCLPSLTGKAAKWAIHMEKSHWRVGPEVMMPL